MQPGHSPNIGDKVPKPGIPRKKQMEFFLSLMASLEIMQWHLLSILLAEATKVHPDSKGGNKDPGSRWKSVDIPLKECVGWNMESSHPSIFIKYNLLQVVTARFSSCKITFPSLS